MGLRHGGNVEGADAGLDRCSAPSAERTQDGGDAAVYAKERSNSASVGARKRSRSENEEGEFVGMSR